MPMQSAYMLVRRLEAEITRLVAGAQAAELLDASLQPSIKSLRRDMADARLDVRDYELAETRAEQVKFGNDASERLKTVQQAIVTTSQYNIFSAIEVAELSTMIAQLHERLG